MRGTLETRKQFFLQLKHEKPELIEKTTSREKFHIAKKKQKKFANP